MAKYRKLPVVIDAFQMTNERRWNNSEWPDWLIIAWQKVPSEGALWPDAADWTRERLVCGTLEGVQQISWDDFIIKGVDGEIYPCKPSIFKKTHELVEEQ